VNPSAQVFIVTQSSPYLEPEETGVRVDETWSNTAIAAMPMDKR
jgi:hypothetical protein